MFLVFSLIFWYSLGPLTIYVLSKIKINITIFSLNIFTAAKSHSLLHRRVIVKYSNKMDFRLSLKIAFENISLTRK